MAKSELEMAMMVFDSFSRIAVQRAVRPNGKASYLCSIPLELNDERRRGQRMETLDGEGETFQAAVFAAARLARSSDPDPWKLCPQHEWKEKIDSQFSNEKYADVYCIHCEAPGEQNRSTKEVTWPTT
ncbi:MAG TPA: hypothetical protein VIX17_11605 [Pyrinomonadaceae bacterium]|jgi:hypothetical protein